MMRAWWGLVLVVALVGCRQKQESVFIDPAFQTLLPEDAVGLVGIRVDKLKKTEFGQKLMAAPMLREVTEDFEQAGQFDPRNDLWDTLVVWTGKEAVVMARGKFSEMGREPQTAPGLQRGNYKGFMTLGTPKEGVLYINASTAMAGKMETLERLIDKRNDGGSKAPQALMDAARTISPNAQFWAAVLGGAIPKPEGGGNIAANLPRLMALLDRATVSADFTYGLQVNSKLWGRGEAETKQLNDTLRGLLGIVRLTEAQKNPELMKLVEAVTIEQEAKSVKISMTAPKELYGKLLELIASLGSRRPG